MPSLQQFLEALDDYVPVTDQDVYDVLLPMAQELIDTTAVPKEIVEKMSKQFNDPGDDVVGQLVKLDKILRRLDLEYSKLIEIIEAKNTGDDE